MRHMKQWNEVDCGHCVAAMVSRKSRELVNEADPKPHSSKGLTTKELLMIFSRLGLRVGMIKASGKLHLRNAEPPEKCCAMLVRRFPRKGSKTPPVGHYVAFDGKRVYDPGAKRPVSWSAYRKRRWKIVRWFVLCGSEPGRPR